MMFEKAKHFNPSRHASGGDPAAEGRFAGLRGGDALRAVEWSELTARLNAARDLRLLLRTESHGSIEGDAASFGDAAASYFALLDDGQPGVNLDALGQSKALGATVPRSDAQCPERAEGRHSDAPRGDARDKR